MLAFMKKFAKGICRRFGLVDKVPVVRLVRCGIDEGKTLKGKNILITGGSSGIGLAIARKCLACGAKVLITGRDKDKLKKCETDLDSSDLRTMKWDLTDFGHLGEILDDVLSMLGGRIDILVNNAGVSQRETILGYTENVWSCLLDANLKAPILLTSQMAKRWVDSRTPGVVLNISSMAGVEPAVDAYSAAKCALNSLTKGWARDLARYGIRVNAIAPGVVVGTNLRGLQRSIDPEGDVKADWIPLGRYAVPEEIAELAVFMLSDCSAYMTGAVVTLDGAGSLR